MNSSEAPRRPFWKHCRYPYLASALILAVLLLLPFFLKTLNGHLEMYPSLVLPSGSNVAKGTETMLTVRYTQVLGVNKHDRQEKVLELNALFNPIPGRFALRVIEVGKLGLGENRRKRVKLKYVPILKNRVFYLDMKKVDERERAEVREWLGTRLEALDCDPSILIIRKVQAKLEKATMQVSPYEIVSEVRYELR